MTPAPFRFLFFLYHFPPATSTAAKRNFRIAHHIANRVINAIVFTAQYPGKQALSTTKLDIRSKPAHDYRSLLRKRTKDGYLPERKKQRVWKQWGIKFINTFPFSILVGEGGLLYCLSLIRRGSKAIREEQITHLYSSFRPFADHVAAYWLKQKFPSVYWIADFRDLVVDPFTQHMFFPKGHQRLCKKMFSKADILITVSDGLAAQLKAYNPNVYKLSNGITNTHEAPSAVRSLHFTIVYTGSMMLGNRNPEPVFESIQQLAKQQFLDVNHIRIIYAGKDGLTWEQLAIKYNLQSQLINRNIIDENETRKLQHTACINLLLSIASPEVQGVLTGKLIEYIEAGSPILAISVGHRDQELQRILQDVSIGEAYSDQEADRMAIQNFIKREYDAWSQSGQNSKPVDWQAVSANYNMQSIIDQFLTRVSPGSHASVRAFSPG